MGLEHVKSIEVGTRLRAGELRASRVRYRGGKAYALSLNGNCVFEFAQVRGARWWVCERLLFADDPEVAGMKLERNPQWV
jgi:hypothetical protein